MDIYNFKWNYLDEHLNSRLKQLFKDKSFADVTLVSDDKFEFPAHKYVLSSCSPVIKDLLLNNYHPHPTIFLRGVKALELQSILELVYLGKTQLNERRMEKFFQVGRELIIKQFCHNEILIGDGNNCEVNQKTPSVNREISRKDYTPIIIRREENNMTYESSLALTKSDVKQGKTIHKIFKCKDCEGHFKSAAGLCNHKKNKHEGIRHSCNMCDYKATTSSHLKKHKESVHYGVRFVCDLCEHSATQQSNLRTHMKSQHEGTR